MKKARAATNGDGETPEVFLNMREVAVELWVPVRFMTLAKKGGAPFYQGKTRAEWIVEWAKKNANDEARHKSCCRECLYYRPRDPGNGAEG